MRRPTKAGDGFKVKMATSMLQHRYSCGLLVQAMVSYQGDSAIRPYLERRNHTQG